MDIIHIHKNLSTIHGYLSGCIHGSPYLEGRRGNLRFGIALSMRKCLTVSTVMPWHFGHAGDSDLHIRKGWWFCPICLKQSWNSKEVCWQSSSDMSHEYFLDRAELSIVHNRFPPSELFHLRCHLFFSLSEFSCWSA